MDITCWTRKCNAGLPFPEMKYHEMSIWLWISKRFFSGLEMRSSIPVIIWPFAYWIAAHLEIVFPIEPQKKELFQRLPELTFHLLQPLPFIRQRAPKKKKPLAPRRSGQRRKQKVLRQPPALIPVNSSIHLCRKINNATRSIVYTAIGRVLHCKVFALFGASSTVLFKHGIK